jgi:hypothetical protein
LMARLLDQFKTIKATAMITTSSIRDAKISSAITCHILQE